MIGDCTVRAIAKSTSAEGSSCWFELLQIVFASDKHLSIYLMESKQYFVSYLSLRCHLVRKTGSGEHTEFHIIIGKAISLSPRL